MPPNTLDHAPPSAYNVQAQSALGMDSIVEASMTDDEQIVLALLASSSDSTKRFAEHYGEFISALARNYGYFCDEDAYIIFWTHLKADCWRCLRGWIPIANTVTLQRFLNNRAKEFFREERQSRQRAILGTITWPEILSAAIGLTVRDRILLGYVYVDKLEGALLVEAVLNNIKLNLNNKDSINSSVSQAMRNLRKHCRADHGRVIDELLRLRQKGGRPSTLKSIKRSGAAHE